jgi:hypothetical protein
MTHLESRQRNGLDFEATLFLAISKKMSHAAHLLLEYSSTDVHIALNASNAFIT